MALQILNTGFWYPNLTIAANAGHGILSNNNIFVVLAEQMNNDFGFELGILAPGLNSCSQLLIGVFSEISGDIVKVGQVEMPRISHTLRTLGNAPPRASEVQRQPTVPPQPPLRDCLLASH